MAGLPRAGKNEEPIVLKPGNNASWGGPHCPQVSMRRNGGGGDVFVVGGMGLSWHLHHLQSKWSPSPSSCAMGTGELPGLGDRGAVWRAGVCA